MMPVTPTRDGEKNGMVPGLPGDQVGPVLDCLDGAVVVMDMHSREILFANEYLKQLLGFDPTGRPCSDFMHGDRQVSCVLCGSAPFESFAEAGGTWRREYQNPFDKKWYSAREQLITWGDGRRVKLQVALDITEQKQLKSFLAEARQQAEQAVAARNRMVALVAHDLKSPFVSILGMLERILRKETFTHEVHRSFLENIINNGQRMLKMIDNLLDMERLEHGRIKPEPVYFKVKGLVAEVFENFAHLASRKGVIMENKVAEKVEIYADKYLYLVVLNNLISNAVKFSYPHGKISVSFVEEGGSQCLVVRDRGKGVPRKYQDDLFRQDVKTTSPGTGGESGSGLGLVFSQQIMRAHGGCIELQSREGQGAVFYVKLRPSCPLGRPAGEESAARDES